MEDPIILPLPPPAGEDQPPSLTPEQVYLEYAPRVFNVARRMVRNETDAEDVAQDVFMTVLRKLPTFRGDAAFPTWLHRVTVNAALAHRRKRAARDAGCSLDEVTDEEHLSRPDLTLADGETRLLIEQAIASLPEIYREVLVLSDVEGIRDAEIAERLELTVAAVKTRLHRARILLRNLLAPHFETM